MIISALLVKVLLAQLPYPDNYSIVYLLAGALLLLGTIGFWLIVEPPGPRIARSSVAEKISEFRNVLKEDANFRKYLLLLNTTGIVTSALPFFILHARTLFTVSSGITGNFLMVQMAGGLLVSVLLSLFSKGKTYRPLLFLFVAISSFTPVVAILVPPDPLWYSLVFFFSGGSFALSQIILSGVLLNISTDANRALYTGLSGAGSIMAIIYPLAAGAMAPLGYPLVFIITAAYSLIGLYAVLTISCKQEMPASR